MSVVFNPFTGSFVIVPPAGAANFKTSVATSASLPLIGNTNGDVRVTLDTSKLYVWDGSVWKPDSITLTANSPLSLSGTTLSISQSNTSTDGYLSSTDWNTFNNKQNALGYTPENIANKGVANGYVPLDSGVKIPAIYLPNSVMQYISTWDPSTNTPALSDGTGTGGYVYYVNAAYSGTIPGLTDPTMYNFQLGNIIIYSSSLGKWEQTTPAAGVQYVNGQQGVVILPRGNLTESTSSILTITGGSSSVWGSGTSIQVQKSDSTHDGYLSSADWNAFNGPLAAATSLATPNTLVKRDGSSGFQAGIIKVGPTQNIEHGSLDAFSRVQILNNETNSVLRLGTWQTDGDATSKSSEGIIVYGDSLLGNAISSGEGSYARVKNNRFGLFDIDSTLPYYSGGAYYFRIDDTQLFYKDNSGNTTFSIQRTSGNTSIAGTVTLSSLNASSLVLTDASKNLTSATPGSISTSTTGVTIANGSNSTIGPNTTINIQTATGSQSGLLSSTDWNTFNNKMNEVVPSSNQMVYVSYLAGSDITGTGSYDKPYQTVAYAMSTISDASQNKPYVIALQANRQIETGDVFIKPYTFIVGMEQRATYIRVNGGQFKPDTSHGTVSSWVGFKNLYIGGSTVINWDLQALGGSNCVMVIENCTSSGSFIFKGRNSGGGDYLEWYGGAIEIGAVTLDSVYAQLQSLEIGGATAFTNTQSIAGLSSTANNCVFDSSLSITSVATMYLNNNAYLSTLTTVGTVGIQSYKGLPVPASCTFSGGTTITHLDNASLIPYTPTVAGNWLSVPTQSQAALDTLSASGIVKSQLANLVLASPNGSSGLPSFRALVSTDIPSLPYASSSLATNNFYIGVAGVATAQSGTQATAILDNLVGDSGSGGTKGLAPAPAAGDSAAGKFLKADGTWAVPSGTSTGSVTTVSVVSANGFAGSVSNPTTTPAITLSTTITGLLKGNGTAISSATSGVDYAPATSGTSILKGNGAGGFGNATAGVEYQAPLTFGNISDVGTDGITITGGTGAIIGSGVTLSQHVADSTHNGYLSSTDWNTFNNKQAAGNYTIASTGDINETSFTAADNQATPANITGLAFANASVRGFKAIISIVRGSTYAIYNIEGIQKASNWEINPSYVGDITGLTFSITAAGQLQYISTNTGSTATLKFRAFTVSV